jgi:hypothetical protein
MERNTLNLHEYIEEQLAEYGDDKPKRGRYAASKEKHHAALLRAISILNLKEIAEEVGVSHDLLKQWNRNKFFSEKVKELEDQFVADFTEWLIGLYAEEQKKYKEQFDRWIQSNSDASPPGLPISRIHGVEMLKPELRRKIAEKISQRLEGSLREDSKQEMMTYQQMLSHILNIDLDPRRAVNFIGTLSSAILQPMLQENDLLSPEERKRLRVLLQAIKIAEDKFQTTEGQ